MWMTNFYIFSGIFFVYLFQSAINLKKLKSFFVVFGVFFFTLPIIYSVDSYFKTNKRTDFPGKQIANTIQNTWNDNFSNQISVIVGSGWVYGGWYAGNLSYQLKNRPVLMYQLKKNSELGTIYVDGLDSIKNCEGILLKVEPYFDSCLIGKK